MIKWSAVSAQWLSAGSPGWIRTSDHSINSHARGSCKAFYNISLRLCSLVPQSLASSKNRPVRIFPSNAFFERMFCLERRISSRWLAPLFSHYNFVGRKKGGTLTANDPQDIVQMIVGCALQCLT
jgi:hypothetical protein